MGHRHLGAGRRHVRADVPAAEAGAAAHGFRRHCPVPRAAPGQCRTAPQRGLRELAAQSLLDAAGAGLHSLDGGTICLDLLRTLSAQVHPDWISFRHHLLLAWHSHDGGDCAAAAQRPASPQAHLRLCGLHPAPALVGLSLFVYGFAVESGRFRAGGVQPHVQHPVQHPEHGDCGRVRYLVAEDEGALAGGLRALDGCRERLHVDFADGHRSGEILHRKFVGIPILVSFLWYGTAGVSACRRKLHEQASQQAPAGSAAATQPAPDEGVWLPRVAMATIISLPFLALWDFWFSGEIQPVRDFRLLVTVLAAIPLGILIFLRQQLLDKERLRLLEESRQSIQDLKQLQTQLVQSEKLVSLGQLAAGAAHDINNPLTAILGYADLRTEDASAGESAKSLACKIRDQARRTKQLVTSLLSFARQVPAERTLLDINAIVTNALQLHALNLRNDHIRIETQLEPVL